MLHCPTCGRQYSEDLRFCPEDNSLLQADATVLGDIAVDPLIGQTLDGKYRLDERLGVGGMGTVYRAKHLLIDRPVAVKVLNQRFVEDEAAQVRFRREAKAAGRLQHANAVEVTDSGQTSDGYVYIVMELLEGQTLREVLTKEAPLETARAVALMIQASAAVAAAHEAGIIHRDLKPANIFIVQRPEVRAVVKVLDFGIAKLAADSFDDEDVSNLTQLGAIIGTPRYMSPEQCSGIKLTPAADVYSLGIILYEMLTGTVPFTGPSPLAIALKHSSESPQPPRALVSSIPSALEQVVLHALEKRPEDRPADAGAFRHELFAVADRLGLEHGEATSAPSLEFLRSAGTQSPSGRLIIDISRLRENRASTAGANEMTVLASGMSPQQADPDGPQASFGNQQTSPERQSFARVSVPLNSASERRKPGLVIPAMVAVFVIAGMGLLAIRSRNAAPLANVNAAASPSASLQPSPAQSPTPSPKQEEKEARKQQPNQKDEKGSRVGRLVNKMKRAFKKRF